MKKSESHSMCRFKIRKKILPTEISVLKGKKEGKNPLMISGLEAKSRVHHRKSKAMLSSSQIVLPAQNISPLSTLEAKTIYTPSITVKKQGCTMRDKNVYRKSITIKPFKQEEIPSNPKTDYKYSINIAQKLSMSGSQKLKTLGDAGGKGVKYGPYPYMQKLGSPHNLSLYRKNNPNFGGKCPNHQSQGSLLHISDNNLSPTTKERTPMKYGCRKGGNYINKLPVILLKDGEVKWSEERRAPGAAPTLNMDLEPVAPEKVEVVPMLKRKLLQYINRNCSPSALPAHMKQSPKESVGDMEGIQSRKLVASREGGRRGGREHKLEGESEHTNCLQGKGGVEVEGMGVEGMGVEGQVGRLLVHKSRNAHSHSNSNSNSKSHSKSKSKSEEIENRGVNQTFYSRKENKLSIDLLSPITYPSGEMYEHEQQIPRPKSMTGLAPNYQGGHTLPKHQQHKIHEKILGEHENTPNHYLEHVLSQDMLDPKEANLAKFSILHRTPPKRKDSFSSWENAFPMTEKSIYASSKLKAYNKIHQYTNKDPNISIQKKSGSVKAKSNIVTLLPKNYEKDIESHKNRFKIMNYTFRERFLTPSTQYNEEKYVKKAEKMDRFPYVVGNYHILKSVLKRAPALDVGKRQEEGCGASEECLQGGIQGVEGMHKHIYLKGGDCGENVEHLNPYLYRSQDYLDLEEGSEHLGGRKPYAIPGDDIPDHDHNYDPNPPQRTELNISQESTNNGNFVEIINKLDTPGRVDRLRKSPSYLELKPFDNSQNNKIRLVERPGLVGAKNRKYIQIQQFLRDSRLKALYSSNKYTQQYNKLKLPCIDTIANEINI